MAPPDTSTSHDLVVEDEDGHKNEGDTTNLDDDSHA